MAVRIPKGKFDWKETERKIAEGVVGVWWGKGGRQGAHTFHSYYEVTEVRRVRKNGPLEARTRLEKGASLFTEDLNFQTRHLSISAAHSIAAMQDVCVQNDIKKKIYKPPKEGI